MPDENPFGDHPIGDRQAHRLAEAFEVTTEGVLRDALLVRQWIRTEDELLEKLREQHRWDTTVAGFYVRWLRGLEGD